MDNQYNINDTRWSYSKVASYDHCKYEFYLNYIINDDEQYLAENNYYAEVGSFVHKILEMIFSGKLKVEDALQYYLDNYDNNVFYKVKKSIMDKNYVVIADYFANLDIGWLKKYEILGVEKEINFELDNYNFIGFIDLLLRDKTDGRIVVIDHKSTEYPFKKDGGVKKKLEHNFDLYKKQMYLYSHAVYQLYGEFPKEMSWNHFKEDRFATIPFIKSEYEDTLKWFKKMIKSIGKENEFKASENYFYCYNLCNFRNSCEYKILKSRSK